MKSKKEDNIDFHECSIDIEYISIYKLYKDLAHDKINIYQ